MWKSHSNYIFIRKIIAITFFFLIKTHLYDTKNSMEDYFCTNYVLSLGIWIPFRNICVNGVWPKYKILILLFFLFQTSNVKRKSVTFCELGRYLLPTLHIKRKWIRFYCGDVPFFFYIYMYKKIIYIIYV